jgi:hypothetical protein
VFQLFHTYVASVSSECFKSRSEYCTCCNVIHPATTDCCSCLDAVHARGARRDEALLGTGCRKRRVMAAGAQAVLARHASVASRGDAGGKRKGRGHPDRGVKWGAHFPGSSRRVRRRNGLQPRRCLDVRALAVPYRENLNFVFFTYRLYTLIAYKLPNITF